MNGTLTLDLASSLSPEQMRKRVVLAWSVLRRDHILYSATARTVPSSEAATSYSNPFDRYFQVQHISSPQEAIEDAEQQVAFLEDHYSDVQYPNFYHHMLNSGRVIDPLKSLSRLFVLPIDASGQTRQLRLVFVMGHQIADGMSLFRAMAHFTSLMNLSVARLHHRLDLLCSRTPKLHLIPAQESLYPRPPGSLARQRWFWAICRIIRHTRRVTQPAFANPLQRIEPLMSSPRFNTPAYPDVLSYNYFPPVETRILSFNLSTAASRNIQRHCSDIGVTVGAGLFALTAISMMIFHERRRPPDPNNTAQPLSFVGGFPLNIRPFLTMDTTGIEDSLVLGFSDGISLPHLPISLPLIPRFRILARLAHRQLRQYQKRKPAPSSASSPVSQSDSTTQTTAINSQSPHLLIPLLYLSTLERFNLRLPPDRQVPWLNIQGAYPAAVSATGATCGISSVGDRQAKLFAALLAQTTEDEDGDSAVKDTSQTTVPETLASPESQPPTPPSHHPSPPTPSPSPAFRYKSLTSVVRARDNEFLIGTGGSKDSLGFGVSYDANAIDPVLAAEWVEVVKNMFEEGEGGARL